MRPINRLLGKTGINVATRVTVRWCGWNSGRHDLLDEMNTTERDGPVKILCMRCGSEALIDYFKRVATPVDR